MAGFVVVKVRCATCLKRVTTGGSEVCQCEDPKPERIEMRMLTPVKKDQLPVRELAACVS